MELWKKMTIIIIANIKNIKGKVPLNTPSKLAFSATLLKEKQIAVINAPESFETLIEILHENPYQTHPPFEKPLGDLSGAYSLHINIQHRLVYQIIDDEKWIKVIRMWTPYA